MSSSQDEIRAMRLAKLEAAAKNNRKDDDGGDNANATSSKPKSKISGDQLSPTLPIVTTLTSSTLPSAGSISTSQIPSALPASIIDSDSDDLNASTKKKQAFDYDRWKANEMKRILSVTLSPDDSSASHIYLKALSKELGTTDLIAIDDPDIILTTLIFEGGLTGSFTSPLSYLFQCWNMANTSKRLLNKNLTLGYDNKLEFYNEILRLSSGYASILLYEPDTFIDAPNLGDVIGDLVKRIDRYSDFFIAILAAIVDNQTQLQFLNVFLPILTLQIDSLLDSDSMGMSTSSNTSQYNNVIYIVELLTANKAICEYIYQVDIFNPNYKDPTQLEMDTFLGRILRISPLLPKLSVFNYVGVINKNEIKNINDSLSTTYSVLLNKLFHIVDSLIRVNSNSRFEVLKFMASLINKNHLRMSEHADDKKISSDSLMLNISLILIKLSEPILRQGNLSKVDKILTDYLNYPNKMIDISEETRINSTIQEANDHYQDKLYGDDNSLNFISQCFYLMLTYLQYGLGGVIVSYNKKGKILKQMKAQLKQFKEMMNKNGMAGNPLAERLLKMRVEPLEKKIEAYKNDIYSIEMFFHARNFQLEVFDIIIGICEFLVRLIDTNHTYHPKMGNFFPHLKIPLHNFDDDIEKLDDVEYLRSLSPEPFKYFPEIYVEGLINYCHFISKFNNNPMIDNNAQLTKLIEFAIILLRCPELLSNPHLKARLIEVLFFGSLPIQTGNGEADGFMIGIFNDDDHVQSNMMISLLDFYVMVEKTGASSQFYDKFNSRYHISFIIEKLWKFDIFKKDLKLIATKYQKFFVRFVARMLNDTTYLLDESLNHLHTIHACQKELTNRSRGIKTTNDESDEDLAKKLQESERMAKSFVQLSNKTILLFNLFTKETPKSFTIVEIVDRLAGMLNYNLVILVGPRYNELKVKDPERYQFDPKELLFQLCSIFINLSDTWEFVKAVARDGRSFEPKNFYTAINILKKSYKMPDEEFERKLRNFVQSTVSVKSADEEEELELGEAPDEFLDPLMYTLMTDPVKLPTSKISIDRSVLKAHLMNDPTDPFNRMPLKMEEVEDDVELRDKIAAWKQSKRLKQKQGQNQQPDQDGDIEMQH